MSKLHSAEPIHGVLVWYAEAEGAMYRWWNTSMHVRWEYRHRTLFCGLRKPPEVQMHEVENLPSFGLNEAVAFSLGIHRCATDLAKVFLEG